MDDKTLRDNILAALDWDPSINATEIGVTVDKGVVTLTGHVQNVSGKVHRRENRQACQRRACGRAGNRGAATFHQDLGR